MSQMVFWNSLTTRKKLLHVYLSNIEGTLKVVGGKGLTSAYYLFDDCSAQFIDLSSFDTSKVTNMDSMFYKCQAQFLDLLSFDTSNVTDMNSMFLRCQAQSIDISSFDTSDVTDMRGMFDNC